MYIDLHIFTLVGCCIGKQFFYTQLKTRVLCLIHVKGLRATYQDIFILLCKHILILCFLLVSYRKWNIFEHTTTLDESYSFSMLTWTNCTSLTRYDYVSNIAGKLKVIEIICLLIIRLKNSIFYLDFIFWLRIIQIWNNRWHDILCKYC